MININNNIVLEHSSKYKDKIKLELPYNYIEIYLNEHISKDDTVESVAKKYYDQEIYHKIYETIDDYIEEICNLNGLEPYNLTPFQDINVPVLVHKDNVYLSRINELEKEIKNIDEWIKYEVQNGDSLSSLAYDAAGNSTDALSNIEKIKEYNNLTSNDINVGDVLYIINPKIGELKRDIAFLRHQLKESLIKVEKKEVE